MNMPIWKVDLSVEGPVFIKSRVRTRQQKGFKLDDPFYSDIELGSRGGTGFHATIETRAKEGTAAHHAAVVFFGQMLDCLTLKVNQPMSISSAERNGADRQRYDTRRILELNEIEDAFAESHLLRTNSSSYLRGAGWYRKGLYTQDQFDAYLALWNSIEVIASQQYKDIPTIDHERAKNGTKSQIWECFKVLWSECDHWPIISGKDNWIDERYNTRVGIAHGTKDVTVTEIMHVAEQVPELAKVAHQFLADWRKVILESTCHISGLKDGNQM